MNILKVILYLALLINICQSSPCSEKISEATEAVCNGLDVDTDKTNTHICILDGDACKETNICSEATYVTSDLQCSKLTVDASKVNYVCIKSLVAESTNCVETNACTDVKFSATPEKCSKLALSAEKDSNDFICSKNSVEGSTDCVETNICKEVLYVAQDSDCSKFKISDEDALKKCVKKTDGDGCVEQPIDCEDKTTGGSDEVCSKLTPSTNHACGKDPDPNGQGCKNIPYCKYASGNSDEDCKKYPVESKDNECVKGATDNTCDEKEKVEETPGGGEESKDSTKSTDKDSKVEEKDSDKVEEKGSDIGTDEDEKKSTDAAASKETNKTEQGKTDDKEGKASFIELSLVYFFLLYLL